MTRSSILITSVVSLLLGSACRGPYQPYICEKLWGVEGPCIGHSSVELRPGVYQVRYEGGKNRALIEDYTLLRSAELTIESGYRYFAVARVVDETSTETRTSPGTYHAPETKCSGHGDDKVCVTSPGHWSGGGTYTATLPGYAYTIHFVDDEAAVGESRVYDAHSVRRDLRQKYGLRAPSAGEGSGVGAGPR